MNERKSVDGEVWCNAEAKNVVQKKTHKKHTHVDDLYARDGILQENKTAKHTYPPSLFIISFRFASPPPLFRPRGDETWTSGEMRFVCVCVFFFSVFFLKFEIAFYSSSHLHTRRHSKKIIPFGSFSIKLSE